MLNVYGMQNLPMSYNGRTTIQKVYLVHDQDEALLGKKAIRALKIIRRVDQVKVNQVTIKRSPLVEDQFQHLFRGFGDMPGDYNIALTADAKPFAITTPRRIPLPLYPKTKTGLDKLYEKKIINRVTGPTDWVAPMVVVPKPGGKVRICVDYSRLNEFVKREYHQIPPIEETLSKLAGAVYFTKLDADSGFFQVPLGKSSRLLTTFLTPWGRFYFNKLPQGISSAPEVFQARMMRMLEGCSNVVCHMDDILVWGSTIEEHDKNLQAVLQQISDTGMTLNREKCVFRIKKVKFLGHLLEDGKILADPNKTEAIVKMEPPKSKSELHSLLGSVNFLARHIPDRSTLLEPLYSLLKNDIEFVWESAQRSAFQKLKEILANAPVLAIYDPKKSTTISCDASSYGLGAVLLQKAESGNLLPVAFASRTLSDAEKRYAQIEKEALAIAWACTRFDNYLIGLKFTIETDHKPLLPLLTTKFFDELTPRLQRICLRLLRFNYDVIHTAGKNLVTADLLSRKPVSESTNEDKKFEVELQTVAIQAVNHLNCSQSMLERIKAAQHEIDLGKKLEHYIETGWPNQRKDVSEEMIAYWQHQSSLSIEDGLILFSRRVWIPPSLRSEMLKKLHESHFGVTKTCALARTAIWWPNIDKDIEKMVSDCETCAASRPNRSEPLVPSPLPNHPWEKIGADLLKEGGKWWLVLIDYYSKFIEMAPIERLDSKTVIKKLEAIFARFGIPRTVFTDNGTQLVSAEMKKFAEDFDFIIVTRSPAYPQANGLAEAAVKIAKKILNTPRPAVALMNYRATPTAVGYSPAQLLFNRQIRTKVPSMNLDNRVIKRADLEERDQRRRDRMKHNFDRAKGARPLPELSPGRNVFVEDASKKGTIIKRHDEPRSYDVKIENGAELRRNRKSLRRLPSRHPDWPEPEPSSSSPQPTPRRSPKVEPISTPPSSSKTPSASKIPSPVPRSTYPLRPRKPIYYGSP